MTTLEVLRTLNKMPDTALSAMADTVGKYDCNSLPCHDCVFNYAIGDENLTGCLVHDIYKVAALRGV